MSREYIYQSLSKEQWIEFFRSSLFCDDLKRIIFTIYSKEGKKLNAKEINKNLLYNHYAVINQIVYRAAQKICDYFDIKDLPKRENGSVSWWNILFDGEEANLKFYWKIKPNMICAIEKLKLFDSYYITPIFFANITWMDFYNGENVFKNPSAAWVKQNNDAHEKYNFQEINGQYYGFVECRNYKINIEKISSNFACEICVDSKGNRYIEGSTIVFFSCHPEGKTYIVGFYRNARIYENIQLDKNKGYYFSCEKKHAVLIPSDKRDFQIPKNDSEVNYYGQDQRWYADKIEHIPFIISVMEYINNYIENEVLNDLIESDIFDSYSRYSVDFDRNLLKGELPLPQILQHKYKKSTSSGTIHSMLKKARSGRRAEKYFFGYLTSIGFEENKDFYDVANNKSHGWDAVLKINDENINFEIKNIASGSFYLSDNEIAQLLEGETILVLVDINNGIWMFPKKSSWILENINKIKLIRKYCEQTFPSLDLTDIRILLDEKAKGDLVNIADFSKLELLEFCKSNV